MITIRFIGIFLVTLITAGCATPRTATTGTSAIAGTVKFQGRSPRPRPINAGAVPGRVARAMLGERVVVNDNGTLRNVFVYVKQGLDSHATFPTPRGAVVLDQKNRAFV